LVSGAFAPLLEMIAGRLGVPHAIGTPLEVHSGRYTGRIIEPLCQADGKLKRVDAYFATRGLSVDWAASFAYADQDIDLPLLGRVGNAVAVYPDQALLAHARAQGWPVVGETGG
jgi:phosphoserine phosphatase